jgi:hypothetical protein
MFPEIVDATHAARKTAEFWRGPRQCSKNDARGGG